MERISVCGNSGAGKSTFTEELGAITRLPVCHLDLLQFKPGWQKTPELEFAAAHDRWLAQPRWIIEGVGDWKPLKKRFEAADTLLYLDFPEDLCLANALKRLEADRLQPNPFVPAHSPYAAKADKLEPVIRFFHREWRPRILALMESLRQGRNLYIFTEPAALTQFLAETKRLHTF